MNLKASKWRAFRTLIGSFHLSFSDLSIALVLMGIILIWSLSHHLFLTPTHDLGDRGGIILKQDKKIDINSASYYTLQELPGIGPVMAGRIITYRRLHGDFKSIQEIKNVKGIGSKTFQKLKTRIRLGTD